MSATLIAEPSTNPAANRPVAWSMLQSGIPLTLLLDLFDPCGPCSEEIMQAECRSAT